MQSKNISEVLNGIIDGYTTYLSSKSPEDIVTLIGQFVPSQMIYSCDFTSPLKLKESLSKLFSGRISYLENSGSIANYSDKVRGKLLSVIDEYYVNILNQLTQDRVGAGLTAYSGKNIFDEYRSYAYELLNTITPYIQNEFLAYAMRPALRYGSYIPNFAGVSEEKGVVL